MAATRPVAGAVVESAWGGQVHDQAFTPKGTIANSALVTGIGTVNTTCPLTVGGPNLSGGAFVAPEAGVYAYHAHYVTTALGGAGGLRLPVVLAGSQIAGSGFWQTSTFNGSGVQAHGLVAMAAGQTLAFQACGASGTSGMSCTMYVTIHKVGESVA